MVKQSDWNNLASGTNYLCYLCISVNQNALQKQLKAGEIYFASQFQKVSEHHSEEDKAEYLSAGAHGSYPLHCSGPERSVGTLIMGQALSLKVALPQAMAHFLKVAQPSQTAPGREQELVI